MIKKILYTIIVMFLFVSFCYAEGESQAKCGVNERVDLAERASMVRITWEPTYSYCFIDEYGVEHCDIDPDGLSDYYFNYVINVKIYNLDDNLFILASSEELSDDIYIDSSLKGEDGAVTIRIDDTTYVKNISFNIYGKNGSCYLYSVKTVNLTVPKFNHYSRLSACEDIKDFYLCQDYITFDIDGSKFEENVDNYKKKLSAAKDNGLDEEENNSAVSVAVGFLAKYKYFVLVIVVAIGLVLTFIVLNSKRVRR